MIRIRKMKYTDLDQVMEIEEASFASPWCVDSFRSELEKTYGFSLVAIDDNHIIGYITGWFIVDEIHIANLAVHKKRRRTGVATALIREVTLRFPEGRWANLEVRRSNKPAISLYRRLGFTEAGIRKNYYVNENEDAILMIKYLSENSMIEVNL